MARFLPATALAVCAATIGACGHSTNTAPKAPAAPTATNPDAGDVNPEDPKAGLNTNRPDSSEDVKPPPAR